MRNEIRKIIKDNNLTAIYVTHDRNEAMAIADRIAIMRDGEIVQIGTPFELYDYPNSMFSAEFMGETNFFEGKFIEKLGDNYLKIATQYGEWICNNYYQYDYNLGDNVILTTRMENIKISSITDELNDDSNNKFVGKLLDFCFMGDRGEYIFELSDGKNIRVSSSPFMNLGKNEQYTLKFATEKAVVLKE